MFRVAGWSDFVGEFFRGRGRGGRREELEIGADFARESESQFSIPLTHCDPCDLCV